MARKTTQLGFQCLYDMKCALPALQRHVLPNGIHAVWLSRFDITLGLHCIFSSWTSGLVVQ